MSTMYLASTAGDCENYMTPARLAELMRRNKAIMRRREIERREMAQKRLDDFGGVLPADSSEHDFDAAWGASYIGGILLTDGSVHLFDRDEIEHYDYACDIGVSVHCGGCDGDDGWAFYVRTENRSWYDYKWIGDGYMVPEDLGAALDNVVEGLLEKLTQ